MAFPELREQKISFPPVIIVDNDLIALSSMKIFLRCGIWIPEDISIIGFNEFHRSRSLSRNFFQYACRVMILEKLLSIRF